MKPILKPAPLPAAPMLLIDIINKYKDQTIADESDINLIDAQTTLDILHRGLVRVGETEFCSKVHLGMSITLPDVITIEQFITRTLNTRYGCND